jgi:hypothetical protein
MGRFKHGNEKDGKGRFVPPEVVMSNTENEKISTPRFHFLEMGPNMITTERVVPST